MVFSNIILAWYGTNKRVLPWRNTLDPYRIWLSEIMLQQTRVAQGTPYYHKFISAFPKVEDLANADEEAVLKLWQGLGYYSRARNLHATAKIVAEKYGGIFPNTYKELLTLKGVGDYTASAIASICFNEAVPVVDGNVYRVLSRYYGMDLPINSPEGIKEFKKLALKVMAPRNIRDYNQGIMEFGALQCTPQKPDCQTCPLNISCVAYNNDSISSLPVKLKKTKVKHRYFNYLVVVDANNQTLVQQRTGNGIWRQLYEFPLLESDQEVALPEVSKSAPELLGVQEDAEVYLYNDKNIVHKLSHQHLHTKFWIVSTTTILENGVPLSTLPEYPVPVLIADFINTFKI